MSSDLEKKLNSFTEKRKARKKWLAVVVSLAAVVAAGTSYVLINPATTQVQETFCGLEEHKEHTYDCYEKTLVCLIPEEGHTHSESCYEEEQVLICSLQETEGHTHSDACYGTEKYLSCGFEETDGHQHDKDCYETERVLICNNTSEEHEHTDECYEERETLVCQLNECEPHHHDENCYSERQVLICGQEECEPHHHSDSCYETRTVCTCSMEECEHHQHSEECYVINYEHLLCDLPIHEHTLQCFSNPEADLETAAVWVKTFADVEFSGKWNEDVVAIAESQLGYHESTANYEVEGLNSDSPAIKGYTRYGAWYGIPYGDWCAMFCSFCINYAGVEDYPLHSYCDSWITSLTELNLYHMTGADEETYIPRPGDIIFYDYDSFDPEHPECRGCDHVGLVAELVYDETTGQITIIKTIEGNWNNCVSRVEHEYDDEIIMGYGEMISNPDYVEPVEEITVPECDCNSGADTLISHSDVCARKTFVMTLCSEKTAEEIHNIWKQLPDDVKEFAPIYLSWIDQAKLAELNELIAAAPHEAADGDITVAIAGTIPSGAAAELHALDDNGNELVKNCIENKLGQLSGALYSGAIDVGLYKDGAKVDLSGETVTVTVGGFDFGGLCGDELLVRGYHLVGTDAADIDALDAAEPEIEIIPASIDENGNIVFETDGFSVIYFTVDFHYLNSVYNLQNGESILLSELFPVLGLDFDAALIQSVEFSDPALLDITDVIGEDGETVTDWRLSTTIPFDSEENLTVTFMNGQVLVICVTDEQVSGTYWQRVSAIDDTTANYLIVSAEGNFALTAGTTGATSVNGTAVKLVPVKGNPGYYTIANVSSSMRWRFGSTVSSSGGNTTIRRGSRGVYLYVTRTGSNNNYNYPIFNSSSGNMNLQYQSASGTWTVQGTASNVTSRYLRISDSANGTFDASNSTNNTYRRNMIILKQVDTTLSIPGDVTGGSGTGGSSGTEITQPTYAPDTTSVSGRKQGDIGEVTDIVPGASDVITGTYASDPSTSQIEDYFFSSVQNGTAPEVNDGMVMTDKSVIYGADDYEAFSSYDEGTFGVVLSVLGQDYQLKTVDQVKIPVDVVFVLDVSGSMGNSAGNVTRREAVVNAVNAAMKQIMDDNPENRAGVVLYSSGGSTLLGLDHYEAGNNNRYLVHDSSKIRTAANLRGANVGTVAQTYGETDGFTQSHGTYTQYGIALGAKLLQDNRDTTYTATLNKGTDYEREVTVTRQPVIILLSDGDPTHCTSNYTDVLSGPAYGNGVYTEENNNKGIQGYYTILSANYYKRIVGIHYNVPAAFYTIGMGINQSGVADLSDSSATGDHYKRAVLNPTSDSISQLDSTSAKNYETTAYQLRDLLNGTYANNTVTVRSTSSYNNIGTTNTVVPVLPNPYSGNYSYADGAYFGDLSSSDLEDVFGEIISGSLNVKSYGFMLCQGTSVSISDEIGDGMEIKGTPVLRYNGQNYSLTKVGSGDTYSYVCNATATTSDGSGVNNTQRTVGLTDIKINVTTVNGIQTVSMVVPESVIPSYTPEVTADWYYEELPVRLIYQVGLTDDARNDVKNLSPGETLTYYTNAWENDTYAQSMQYPHPDNPYYNDVEYEDGHSCNKQYSDYSINKSDNTTGTAYTSHDSEEMRRYGSSAEEQAIRVGLGNNGRLTFTNTAPSAIEIRKVDMNDNLITGSEATFKLYSDSDLASTHLIDTYTTVNGVLTIEDLETGVPYWLLETQAPAGYNKAPVAQQFTLAADGTATGIDASAFLYWSATDNALLFRNPSGYELPETGGIGRIPFYAFGTMLIAGALMYSHRKRRRERRAG